MFLILFQLILVGLLSVEMLDEEEFMMFKLDELLRLKEVYVAEINF